LVLAWWRDAPAVAALVRAAFLHAAELVAEWPEIGELSKRPGVHKWLVEVIKDRLYYHLYYRVKKRARRVEVIIFRNASRRPLKGY
jgi:plasmid stabilization system protein ParE